MKKHLLTVVLAGLVILALPPLISRSAPPPAPHVGMSLRQIAHDAGVKGRELAERLGLPADVDKDTSLADLGISQGQLDAALGRASAGQEQRNGDIPDLHTGMTLQEAAHAIGTTGTELAHILGLSPDADKMTPLRDLGVGEADLAEALKQASHEDRGGLEQLKYPFWVLLCVAAVVLLIKGRASRTVFNGSLALSLAVTGFILGKAPNPMESVVKIFKTAAGIYPDYGAKIAGFAFFCALAVIGNKVICGWGCPFGALQELLYEIPLGKKIARVRAMKLPFRLTNTLRALLFAAFVLVIFGVAGNRRGVVLYHYINPFNLFDYDLAMASVLIAVSVFLLASPFLYRSFCQLLCPFGLISWLLEKISLTRIRIDRASCTRCMACVTACPLDAMKGRMDGSPWPADCFSCARCLRACRFEALGYGGNTGRVRER